MIKLIEANSLKDYASGAISRITARSLAIRYKNDYGYSVTSAVVTKKYGILDVIFKVRSTFGNGSPKVFGITKSEPGYYTIILRFKDISSINDFSNWYSLSKEEKENILQQIFELCTCLMYSDDPSFFYQGVWEDLDKENLALFKFPKQYEGKGIWHARHNAGSSLSNPNVHVTKHIAQIAESYLGFIDDIINIIDSKHSIKENFLLGNKMKRLEEVTVNDLKDLLNKLNPNQEISQSDEESFNKVYALIQGNKSKDIDEILSIIKNAIPSSITNISINEDAIKESILNYNGPAAALKNVLVSPMLHNRIFLEINKSDKIHSLNMFKSIEIYKDENDKDEKGNPKVYYFNDEVIRFLMSLNKTFSTSKSRNTRGNSELLFSLLLGGKLTIKNDILAYNKLFDVKSGQARLDTTGVKANVSFDQNEFIKIFTNLANAQLESNGASVEDINRFYKSITNQKYIEKSESEEPTNQFEIEGGPSIGGLESAGTGIDNSLQSGSSWLRKAPSKKINGKTVDQYRHSTVIDFDRKAFKAVYIPIIKDKFIDKEHIINSDFFTELFKQYEYGRLSNLDSQGISGKYLDDVSAVFGNSMNSSNADDAWNAVAKFDFIYFVLDKDMTNKVNDINKDRVSAIGDKIASPVNEDYLILTKTISGDNNIAFLGIPLKGTIMTGKGKEVNAPNFEKFDTHAKSGDIKFKKADYSSQGSNIGVELNQNKVEESEERNIKFLKYL